MATVPEIYAAMDEFIQTESKEVIDQARVQASIGSYDLVLPGTTMSRIGSMAPVLRANGFSLEGSSISWRNAKSGDAKKLLAISASVVVMMGKKYFTDRWPAWKTIIEDKIFDGVENIVVPCPSIYADAVQAEFVKRGIAVKMTSPGDIVSMQLSFKRPSASASAGKK